MQTVSDKPSRFKEATGMIVEVKLWEAFLLYNRHNIYSTLSTYSLDNGPVENDNDLSTVTFRFSAFDWNNTLRDLLYDNNIPVVRAVNTMGVYTS